MDIIYSFWKGGPKPEDPVLEKRSSVSSEVPAESSSETVENPVEETQPSPEQAISPSEPKPNEDPTGEIKGTEGEDESGAGIAVDLHEVSHKAIESAKSFGSFLYSVANKAGRHVSETAKQVKHTIEENTILSDFNKEQESFVKGKSSQAKESGCAPWVGCTDEESVKQQILSLSADKRNFVRSPPAAVQFDFNFEEMHPVAEAVLQEDKNLQGMRFELVPKLVNEETFWRNYFYRVSLIKQSIQLASLGQERAGSSCDTSSRSSIDSSSEDSVKAAVKKHQSAEDDDGTLADSPTQEFVSDAYENSKTVSVEDIKQGMKQLGMAERAGKGDEEWEKELQKELQEYEVVADSTEASADWENEIAEMLNTENSTTTTQ